MTMLEILTTLLLTACVIAIVMVAKAISLLAVELRNRDTLRQVRDQQIHAMNRPYSNIPIDWQPARAPEPEPEPAPALDYTREPDGAEMVDQMLGARVR